MRDMRPYALAYVGNSYCYATRGWILSDALIRAKRGQYKQEKNSIIPCYRELGTIVMDCIGLLCASASVEKPGDAMGVNGQGYLPNKNGVSGNGFMDGQSANVIVPWGCKPIASIPEPTYAEPNIAVVTKKGDHIGQYLGKDYRDPRTGKTYNGRCCVEATTSGTKRVQVTNLLDRPGSNEWYYWCYVLKSWSEFAERYWAANGTPAPEKPAQGPTEEIVRFCVGDKVRVKPDAKEYYPGLKMPEWVPGKTYTIAQALSNGTPVVKGGKLCELLGELVTWCAVDNLEKV